MSSIFNYFYLPYSRFEFQGKKPTGMWGLRLKLPPKPPRFSLPVQVPINENLLHHQLCNKLNLKLLPSPKKYVFSINNIYNFKTYVS